MSEKLLKASVLGGHPFFHGFLPLGTLPGSYGEESKRSPPGSDGRRVRVISVKFTQSSLLSKDLLSRGKRLVQSSISFATGSISTLVLSSLPGLSEGWEWGRGD